jgi:argininosuccinate lyase
LAKLGIPKLATVAELRMRDVLSVEASVASRTSFGGTAPANVRAAIAAAGKAL